MDFIFISFLGCAVVLLSSSSGLNSIMRTTPKPHLLTHSDSLDEVLSGNYGMMDPHTAQ